MLGTIVIELSIAMVLFSAAGLSQIFGMLGVVSFAHGAFYMLGAFVTVTVLSFGAAMWSPCRLSLRLSLHSRSTTASPLAHLRSYILAYAWSSPRL